MHEHDRALTARALQEGNLLPANSDRFLVHLPSSL
jgi:hypothetical protein